MREVVLKVKRPRLLASEFERQECVHDFPSVVRLSLASTKAPHHTTSTSLPSCRTSTRPSSFTENIGQPQDPEEGFCKHNAMPDSILGDPIDGMDWYDYDQTFSPRWLPRALRMSNASADKIRLITCGYQSVVEYLNQLLVVAGECLEASTNRSARLRLIIIEGFSLPLKQVLIDRRKCPGLAYVDNTDEQHRQRLVWRKSRTQRMSLPGCVHKLLGLRKHALAKTVADHETYFERDLPRREALGVLAPLGQDKAPKASKYYLNRTLYLLFSRTSIYTSKHRCLRSHFQSTTTLRRF